MTQFARMDPGILLGIVNEKLRLECASIDELSVCYEIDAERLNQHLGSIGYRYDPVHNQYTRT